MCIYVLGLPRVKKFGPVFKTNLFGDEMVVVADMEGLKKVSAVICSLASSVTFIAPPYCCPATSLPFPIYICHLDLMTGSWLLPPQIFGGDHKITQWMTSPSLEELCGGDFMGAAKHKDTHMKQVPPLSAN